MAVDFEGDELELSPEELELLDVSEELELSLEELEPSLLDDESDDDEPLLAALFVDSRLSVR